MDIITEAFETDSGGFIFQAFIPGDMPWDMPLAAGQLCDSQYAAIDSLLSIAVKVNGHHYIPRA